TRKVSVSPRTSPYPTDSAVSSTIRHEPGSRLRIHREGTCHPGEWPRLCAPCFPSLQARHQAAPGHCFPPLQYHRACCTLTSDWNARSELEGRAGTRKTRKFLEAFGPPTRL